MLELSARAQTISPSPTLSIDTKTKALKASGVDVVNLSVGEPDFPTPDRAALAGIAAIANQFTKYTDVSGILELRQAIANKLHDENGLSYTPAEIIVSSGAKHSLYNIFRCTKSAARHSRHMQLRQQFLTKLVYRLQ